MVTLSGAQPPSPPSLSDPLPSEPQNAAPPSPDAAKADITATLITLRDACKPGASFCPSEVARALAGPDPQAWGKRMIPVRRAAIALALAGKLVIYRKGKPVDPIDFKGVYRLGPVRQE